MDRHRLKINASAWATGEVELGGQRIENEVRAIDIHLRAGEVNTAVLDLLAVPADIEGIFEVKLTEETQTLLKRLGWIPPA
jgi:hypothetical protein